MSRVRPRTIQSLPTLETPHTRPPRRHHPRPTPIAAPPASPASPRQPSIPLDDAFVSCPC
ncbi:hypothetical protein AFM18_23415 [Achromobacter spanius]|uniref:Uncharacterized protein n=1 Tax=Achromobacter spanius TaxID=217203 RepID=A0AAW3HZR6_9BURK|nr:hypothetical protein AFM18_23415 [Achromobacter spanius]